MDATARQISEVLTAMEIELRRLSLWEPVPPLDADLRSNQPFCCDTLSFPQWLQWVLLPRMHDAVAQNGPYPTRSGIYVYAEEWAMHNCAEGLALLRLVKRFDEVIEAPPSAHH